MSQSERDLGVTLIARARHLVTRDPDRARSYLVQAASLLRHQDDDQVYGEACELMGRIAIATRDHEIARAPLVTARDAYRAVGHTMALARVQGILDFLDEPHPFTSDAEAMAADIALATALFESQPAPHPDTIHEHVRHRARLDIERRGSDRFTPASQRCIDAFQLDPLTAAVFLAAAARDLDRAAAAALRRATGHGQPPGETFLIECVAPSVTEDRPPDLTLLRHALLLDPAYPTSVKVAAPVLDYLIGRPRPADELVAHIETPDPDDTVKDVSIAARAVDFARQRKGCLVIVAPQRAVRNAVANAVAQTLGRELLLLAPAHLRQSQLEHVMRLAVRDARLRDAVLVLDWSLSPELFAEAAVLAALEGHDDVIYLSTHDQRLVTQFLQPPDTLVLSCEPL